MVVKTAKSQKNDKLNPNPTTSDKESDDKRMAAIKDTQKVNKHHFDIINLPRNLADYIGKPVMCYVYFAFTFVCFRFIVFLFCVGSVECDLLFYV